MGRISILAGDAQLAVGKIITCLLIVASAIVCVPYALLFSMLFLSAPDPSARVAASYPWLVIFGTSYVVWLAWREQRWWIAWLCLAALLGVATYGWLTLELP
jgi:hypothetical protein